ncbi:MAG: hypothetical protein U0903_03225 [Planctomycetales bacterium]
MSFRLQILCWFFPPAANICSLHAPGFRTAQVCMPLWEAPFGMKPGMLNSDAGREMTISRRDQSRQLYFVSPVIDFAFIGGLSIATFILLRVFYTQERTPLVIQVAAGLVWICNWPHFAATNYRLYHSRANISQYPFTALLVPWIILLGVCASIASPELIAPYFVKLFLIWSPYHFSGQTVGITLVYARRAGCVIDKLPRLALSTFVFGTFLSQTVRSEVFPEGAEFYGIRYPGLGLPEWSITFASAVMVLGGIGFAAFVVRWSLQNKRLLPPIVLLPALAQFVWFVRASTWLSFTEFVPFFHSLQYLLIAWSMQLKEKMDLRQITPSRKYVFTESLRWGAINFLGGAVLFSLLPFTITRIAGLPSNFATAIVITAVQMHHFFVDGVIWKLKRKTVSSPLLVNISDLINPEPAICPAPHLQLKTGVKSNPQRQKV